ncbi:MAG: DNA mismatch repair protein MutS [Clostridia bacterium]|nr:DNA mismatch repair protein MutS [Clostridia bacterium]
MATLSPMMQQYMQLKEQHPDALLFFRLGDFYELFFDDALTASRELELTLTGRDCGLSERAPMCGVPHHSAQTYLSRLLEKGYKVAIGEQMQDPSETKGLVERAVVRVVTPGTVIEPNMLDERANNYLLSLCLEGERAGIAFADVSTGEFYAYEIQEVRTTLADELARIAPKEIIANDSAVLAAGSGLSIPAKLEPYSAKAYGLAAARETLLEHFGIQSLDAFGMEELKLAVCAAGALMRYLGDTQRNALQHITALRRYRAEAYMLLDRTARRNLELTESLRGRGKQGTLLALMDQTATAMGGRTLRSWIEQPLCERRAIELRLDAVAALHAEHVIMQSLFEELRGVYDIERLLSKLAYRSIHARDCLALCASLERLPGVLALLGGVHSEALDTLAGRIDPLEEVSDLLHRAIHPEAPLTLSDGGVIRDGFDAELDALRAASVEGKQWLADLEAQERETTGIKNLRINYNRVFGYYIEVTKSNYELVPYRYQRKQTLANSERYTTPELLDLEQKILGAEDKAQRLEQLLFADVRQQLGAFLRRLQRTAEAVKTLDALLSLALAAARFGYTRPQITEDGALTIVDGRHPVVERNLRETSFVPNDTTMDRGDNRMLIVTGPNMAGKSTYMRQVALITLMAHIGSFVPAKSAQICLTDRIFTRVGASDDLAGGQSTFMVEMHEMANILHNVTPNSLVILDEIGRGTSTFDGLSIAWAVVEHLCDTDRAGAKTLFATHYHELSELEGRLPGVVNFRVSAKEHGEDIIFLRKIVRGGADKSFGVHVARLAGMPQRVLHRAQEILARLEAADVNQTSIGQNILEAGREERNAQVTLFDSAATELVQELSELDVMGITPMEAMQLLFTLKERARRV